MFTLEGIQFLGFFFLIENKVRELLLSENYNFRVLDFYLYKRYSLHEHFCTKQKNLQIKCQLVKLGHDTKERHTRLYELYKAANSNA